MEYDLGSTDLVDCPDPVSQYCKSVLVQVPKYQSEKCLFPICDEKKSL